VRERKREKEEGKVQKQNFRCGGLAPFLPFPPPLFRGGSFPSKGEAGANTQ